MPMILWRPELFAALGAGFQSDTTLMDGVHLRWSLDPRLGLPRAPRDAGFEVAFSRIKEGSITRVDLFQPSGPYPVRSNKAALPAGSGVVHREGDLLSFLRPLGAQDWVPYWLYRHNRVLLDAQLLAQGEATKQFLAYMDGVMGGLGPESPKKFSQREDAVAVDLRFRQPLLPGGLGPFLPIEIGPVVTPPSMLPRTGTIPRGIFDLPTFDYRFRPKIFATVQGFDYCGRLVAEDWVGRHPQIIFGHPTGPFPVQAGALKLTARLRAPGIRTVKVQRRPGYGPLAEDEIRWVFCDDYASGQGLWTVLDHEVLQTDPNAFTGDTLRDEVYAPFHAASLPNDWAEMAMRLRARFIKAPEFQGLLSADDTFETATFAAKITDHDAPTGTSDDSIMLPLLPALLSGAVDPLVARLLGLYGFIPQNPDFQSRNDWRILVRPPFGNYDNLDQLDLRLRKIMSKVTGPGQLFFHYPGDSLTDLTLAGLVLDAKESKKPQPPKPQPVLDAEVRLVPAKPDGFDNLVRAIITAAPETMETRPWLVNASYEVIRGLTGESSVNATDDGETGPLDDIGLLPDVLVPEFNSKTCVSTGRLIDIFARDATEDRKLAYLVRGFDLFGRPSEHGETPPLDLPAACLPPPPVGSVSAWVTPRVEP